MENITLTPKQQKFCDEYLIDLNATQAALRAGYSGSTALNGNLMTIPKIRYYLQQRTEQVTRKVQVNHEMVLTELMKTAFSNMRNYYRSDGSLKGMHELTDDEAAALWCLKVTDGKDGQSTVIRLNNKLSALEKIARHLKFYEAELPQPDTVYVYLDPEKLDDYDKFDDELFDDADDDEEEYYDDEDDEYYPWDTECKIAVAQARAACKLRKGESQKLKAESEDDEEEDSYEQEYEEEEEDGYEEEEVAAAVAVAGEDSSMSGKMELEADSGAYQRVGGAVDFGVKKPEEPKKTGGHCDIPLMKAYSKEYEGRVSW
jgi:hypothetical protein